MLEVMVDHLRCTIWALILFSLLIKSQTHNEAEVSIKNSINLTKKELDTLMTSIYSKNLDKMDEKIFVGPHNK
ncbi:hypothetical protein MXB_2290, partial [Myxobolus squamalis]